MSDIESMPMRYGWTFRAVPLNGRDCWLRYKDGEVDGPYPALCLLVVVPLAQADAEVVTDFLEDKTHDPPRQRAIHSVQPNDVLDHSISTSADYLAKWVVLAAPPEWDDDTFELGIGTGPEVWWTRPPSPEPGESKP